MIHISYCLIRAGTCGQGEGAALTQRYNISLQLLTGDEGSKRKHQACTRWEQGKVQVSVVDVELDVRNLYAQVAGGEQAGRLTGRSTFYHHPARRAEPRGR